MFASELMEAIRKDPAKYEGKRYKVTAGHAEHNGTAFSMVEVYKDHTTESDMTLVGVNRVGERTPCLVSVHTRTQLKEISKPVSIEEAKKAYKACKMVECRFPDYNNRTEERSMKFWKDPFTERPMNNSENSGDDLTMYMLETGTWYILD